MFALEATQDLDITSNSASPLGKFGNIVVSYFLFF